MTFLETERLLFRSHEPQDEPVFIAMHTDSEVRRYVGGKPWPLEKAQFRFRNQFLGRPIDAYGLWATIFKEEANYIGCCGLRPGEHQAEAHLGFYLGPVRTGVEVLPPRPPRRSLTSPSRACTWIVSQQKSKKEMPPRNIFCRNPDSNT